MRLVFCVGVLAACGLVLAAPVPKEKAKSKTDAEALQGTWQLIDLDNGGLQIPAEAKQIKMAFDGGKITVMSKNDAPKDCTFKLDPSAKPKSIDIAVGGETVLCIYELDGDTLKMCISEDGKAMRPTEFKAGAKGESMVFILNRVPDEKKDK